MRQTPYFTKKGQAVHLSAADQVCIVLKLDAGSWKEILKERFDRGHMEDYLRAKRIRDFERKHGIRFKMEGDGCDSIYWTPIKRRKTGQSKEEKTV